MTDQSYTTAFTVSQSPEESFTAITNVRGWWSEEIEGDTEKLGDEFTYQYKDEHRCRMKLTELVPAKKVVWRVLDNDLSFVEDKAEWIGNELTFDISKENGKTEIRFTQLGLVPEYECFEICSNAWDFYVNTSLRGLITTGKGQPNEKG